MAGYTWLIALLGSLAFVLVLISGVMLYYRRSLRHHGHNTSGLGHKNTLGYLAASTTDTVSTKSLKYFVITVYTSGSFSAFVGHFFFEKKYAYVLAILIEMKVSENFSA